MDAALSSDVSDLPLTLAVVELKRLAFRYIDLRGKLAEDLMETYDAVTFEEATIPVEGQILVELEEPVRKGAVSGVHIVYEAHEGDDVRALQRESQAFFQRSEALLGVKQYRRVGVRFVFETLADDLDEAARRYVGVHDRPEWRIATYGVAWQTRLDDWQATIQTGLVRSSQDPTRGPADRIRFDVDQYRLDPSNQEALQVGVEAAYLRARSALMAFGLPDAGGGANG